MQTLRSGLVDMRYDVTFLYLLTVVDIDVSKSAVIDKKRLENVSNTSSYDLKLSHKFTKKISRTKSRRKFFKKIH